jgi:hypothetical protein
MSHLHTDKTRRLGSLRLHWFAFDEARTAANFALVFGNSLSPVDKRIARSLSFQAITAYGRPFTRCRGVSGLKSKGNADLIKLRHEITAHTDATRHIYTTKVTIVGGNPVNASTTSDLLPSMNQVIAESAKELNLVTEEITALEEDIRGLGLPDGDYE